MITIAPPVSWLPQPSMREYHAAEGWNSGRIRALAKSINTLESDAEYKKNMMYGSVLHYLLQSNPDNMTIAPGSQYGMMVQFLHICGMGEEFLLVPPFYKGSNLYEIQQRGAKPTSRRCNAYRDLAHRTHKKCILMSEFMECVNCAAHFRYNDQCKAAVFARKMLYEWPFFPEVSHRWQVKNSAGDLVKGKIRIDGLSFLKRTQSWVMMSIKTTVKTPSPEFWFSPWTYDRYYLLQDAWYLMGAEDMLGYRPDLVMLVVQRIPPYDCALYSIWQNSGQYAWQSEEQYQQVEARMHKIRVCEHTVIMPTLERIQQRDRGKVVYNEWQEGIV